jgi:MurNAc alpha-1-phosphate uridylyltransferase
MNINTALILCAGFSKRLNPLTLKTPKPLLKINDITLLENTINLVIRLGIKKIKLNTYYLQEQIKDFVEKKKFKIEIEIISDGEKILDTGGGIFNMIQSSNDENFIIFNPDTIWNLNYLKVINEMEYFYFSKEMENILLVVEKKLSFDKNFRGDFSLTKNLLQKESINNYVYTGCQIINKKRFDHIKSKIFSIMEIWNNLISEKKLFGFESKNKFLHITNIEVYNNLLKND